MLSLADQDVIILCGGLGTRIRSIDDGKPKVMIDVCGRPFMDYVLFHLSKQGFRRVILGIGYKAGMIEEFYKKVRFGLKIDFVIEEDQLGTGGAIKNALSQVESDVFFALNGDCYCPLNYEQFFLDYQKKQSRASIAVKLLKNVKDFGVIKLDEQMKIQAFLEKQTAEEAFINTGVYCLEKKLYQENSPEGKFSIEYDVFPKLIGKSFYGFPVDVPFFDMGTPERLVMVTQFLKEHPLED